MPELGLKNKYQRRHCKGARRQRANDSRRRLLPEYYVLWLLLHNARIKGMPHLPPHNTPYARGIGRSLTTFTRPHTGANNGTVPYGTGIISMTESTPRGIAQTINRITQYNYSDNNYMIITVLHQRSSDINTCPSLTTNPLAFINNNYPMQGI